MEHLQNLSKTLWKDGLQSDIIPKVCVNLFSYVQRRRML